MHCQAISLRTPLSLLLTIICLLGTNSDAAYPSKPNVLLIVADDLGYGELGLQGNTQIPTPHLDSLARNGTRFTSGYVSGPYCSPTRAGLLTGRYQQRFGHEFNPGPALVAAKTFGLSLKETTLGNRLKEAGYATGWFGKSHLGYAPQFHPLKRGFDEYFGFLGGAHDYLDAAGDSNNPILRGTNRVSSVQYTTEAFGEETVHFIEQHRAEPWFAYLAFNAVHAPLESTEKYLARFPDITERKRHTFAAMLSAMDEAVGAVLGKIRELGQEENTLIFFISDNGGPTAQTTSGNGPLRGFKAQTWEGGIRVPYVIQWKGHLPAGRVDSRPVIQLDILPTALAAAGVAIQPEWKLDGVNLLPYLSGEKTGSPHEALYWRFGGQLAIRKGDWKLVKAPNMTRGSAGVRGTPTTSGAELYNLAQDLSEKHNLAEQEPETVRELAADWNRWNAELVEPAWRPGNPDAGQESAAEPSSKSEANPSGPWKLGDVVPPTKAPGIASKPLYLAATITPNSADGVIVAQGGTANGYSFYLAGGKLHFALRSARQLSVVSADQALPPGTSKVAISLDMGRKVTIFVNDQAVGHGQVKRLISAQPQRGLSVGSDGSRLADYKGNGEFKGAIENVIVRTEAAPQGK